jgi:hypothetical protein
MHRTLVLLLALLSSAAFPQTTTVSVTPQRDSAAVATVQKAINAMGGSAVSGMTDCTAQASVQPDPATHTSPYTMTYQNSQTDFRYQSVKDGETVVSVSGAGRPAVQANGKITHPPVHPLLTYFPQHLSALALSQRLANPNYSISSRGAGTVHGQAVAQVAIRLESEKYLPGLTAQIWSFDIATGLPLRVDYSIADPQDGNNMLAAAVEFSDYRTISGILVPFQMTSYIGGVKSDVTTITSVAFNSGLSPSAFQLSGGTQ